MVSPSQHTARGLDNGRLKDKLGSLYAMAIADILQADFPDFAF
jgi:hypothetical protein